MEFNTKCLHAGYTPKNGEPRVVPIIQSTTYRYDSAEQIGEIFDLNSSGFFYSRISNPTVDALEQKIAALEGGIGAVCLASGQAATTAAALTLCSTGDHILCCNTVYGGSYNLFNVVFKRYGIDTTFFNMDISEAELAALVKPNTRFIFAETLSNPSLVVCDFDKLSKVAKKADIPLIIDNTFASPALCNPFKLGADIITHSTSKYIDGHAVAVGGAVVDGGTYNWANGKFPSLSEPDESYHGTVFTDTFGKAAYLGKLRLQIIRDMGGCMAPQNAFLTNLGAETLGLRMRKHSDNALQIAEFLQTLDKVNKVNYPGLKDNKYYHLAHKYLPNGCSGVVSLEVNGNTKETMAMVNKLKLVSIVTHVSDVRSFMQHPASSTHRQLSDKELRETGISEGLLRLSVGIEDVEDIIADLKQAFA